MEHGPQGGHDRVRTVPVPVLEAEVRRLRARVRELEREMGDVEAFAAVAGA
jgi:hypothetical protein